MLRVVLMSGVQVAELHLDDLRATATGTNSSELLGKQGQEKKLRTKKCREVFGLLCVLI